MSASTAEALMKVSLVPWIDSTMPPDQEYDPGAPNTDAPLVGRDKELYMMRLNVVERHWIRSKAAKKI